MKNYLAALAVLSIVFSSCKKDRSCSCTVTTSGTTTTHTQTTGFEPFLPGTDTTTYQPLSSSNTLKQDYNKVSKKTMRGNCVAHSQESLNQNTSNTSPGIFTITTTDNGTKVYDCKIE